MKMPAMILGGLALFLINAAAPADAAHLKGARAQASPAEAGHAYRQTGPYPWCADYNNMTGNCGFESFNQCLEAARGNGGGCIPNPRHAPAEGALTAPP